MKELGLSENIIFTGFIKEDELNHLVKYSYIGLAIWSCNVPTSATYGDPEKIRRYFHFGLPVVATENAFTADTIKKHGAGIVVDDKVTSVTKAIIELFEDEILYSKCAKASQDLGQHFKENNLIDESINDLHQRKML